MRIAPKTTPGKKPARTPFVVKVGQFDEDMAEPARALGDGVCSVLETGVMVVPVPVVVDAPAAPAAAVITVEVDFEDADADANAQTLP